jgi:HEAT repeat protein
MFNILVEAKELLRRDYGSPDADWQVISKLLDKAPDQRQRLMEWIFAEHQGYVNTRTQAGREILSNDPEQGWRILERLINSEDPDDRDTALTLLAESRDPRAYPLARRILDDPYPYLQFDAIEFLKSIYPVEVAITLRNLSEHKLEWVQDEARGLLLETGKATGPGMAGSMMSAANPRIKPTALRFARHGGLCAP